MSGNNDSFDEATKAYLKGLLEEHTYNVGFDKLDRDDDTVNDESSNPSPTSHATGDAEEEEETPEDFKAMWERLEEVSLAGELYEALLNAPPEEIPDELANAMKSDSNSPPNSPSPAVYDLITEVVEEQSLPNHSSIRFQNGKYSIDTRVSGIRLRQKFDTMEQAALGLLYAKLKGMTDKDSPDHIRENATQAFMDIFNYSEAHTKLYNEFEHHINRMRTDKKVDIPDIINASIEAEKQKNRSTKRMKPT